MPHTEMQFKIMKNLRVTIIWALMQFALIPVAWCDSTLDDLPRPAHTNEKLPSSGINTVGMILMAEAYAAGYSGLMTMDPKTGGWVTLAILPLGVGMNDQTDLFLQISGSIFFASVAAYNISVLKNPELSKRTVFARNEIALHGGFALMCLAGIATGQFKKKDTQLVFTPTLAAESPGFRLVYQF